MNKKCTQAIATHFLQKAISTHSLHSVKKNAHFCP
nr:MAG TPA: hypothetical protein [Bacteriophage sp.]